MGGWRAAVKRQRAVKTELTGVIPLERGGGPSIFRKRWRSSICTPWSTQTLTHTRDFGWSRQKSPRGEMRERAMGGWRAAVKRQRAVKTELTAVKGVFIPWKSRYSEPGLEFPGNPESPEKFSEFLLPPSPASRFARIWFGIDLDDYICNICEPE
jgi:hypothetical protein